MEQSAQNQMELYRELEAARKDWQMALQQFEYAVEREAIDAATYKLLATERRYMYLLKKVGKDQPQNTLQEYTQE